MTTAEKKALAWWKDAERPKRGKTPHDVAVRAMQHGWRDANGKKLDSRDAWEGTLRAH